MQESRSSIPQGFSIKAKAPSEKENSLTTLETFSVRTITGM
jgi:hypothetical protein